MDHYHLTLLEIANLTDRTIKSVYFHARTKEGAIDVPLPVVEKVEEEETEESTLRDLLFLLQSKLISEENYQACVEEARRKYRNGKE